jgi:hypothetical protein
MTAISTSNSNIEGMVMLPIIILLLAASLILWALAQTMYAHILLTKETQNYFIAQQTFNNIIPLLELQLSADNTQTPTPQDQTELLKHSQDWPELSPQQNNIHFYQQLIHKNNRELIYSTLITLGDHSTHQRLIYELISSCTLAEHRCHPVQSTLL